ncbi:MAG: Gfo/Idh/MocA family protein [Elsteraceae bacterium]
MAAALKLAAVGTGYFSQFHYAAWRRIPEISVVGVCDRVASGAASVAATFAQARAFTDFGEMLDRTRPDLVDIISPPDSHLDYVSQAAARGVAVICQKAFCRDLTEAREAVRLASLSTAPVIVHENFRFQPWHRRSKQAIQEGALGEIHQISFRLRPGDGQGPEAYLRRQPYFQQMPRFLVHETAIHLIDTFRFLFGEVSAVYASLRRLNPVIAGEDAGLVIFDFAGGARGLFDGNRLVDHASDNCRRTMGEMIIEGSAGSLTLDGRGRLFFRRHGETAPTEVPYPWRDDSFGGDCVYALQRHMIDHMLTGSALENRASDYLANLVIEQAIYRSDASGQRIEISPAQPPLSPN